VCDVIGYLGLVDLGRSYRTASMMPQSPPQVPSVLPAEAQDLIDNGALLIDVREPNEWNHVRIPGAVLKPMSQINDWYGSLPRDTEVVVQCQTGNRSAHVVNALINQAGFEKALNLTGGIVAWAQAALPIDQTPASSTPA
jgi:rhodanese-related sulfurtransferase